MSELNWPEQAVIYTDGASRGNPGPASLGIYVTDMTGKVVDEIGEPLGSQTNNFAEYTAVKRALELAADKGVQKVILRSDSQLLIRQMIGQYKVKSPSIKPLFLECRELVSRFQAVEFEHVRREFNTEADRLANWALDR